MKYKDIENTEKPIRKGISEYRQKQDSFEPGLSVLDALMFLTVDVAPSKVTLSASENNLE